MTYDPDCHRRAPRLVFVGCRSGGVGGDAAQPGGAGVFRPDAGRVAGVVSGLVDSAGNRGWAVSDLVTHSAINQSKSAVLPAPERRIRATRVLSEWQYLAVRLSLAMARPAFPASFRVQAMRAAGSPFSRLRTAMILTAWFWPLQIPVKLSSIFCHCAQRSFEANDYRARPFRSSPSLANIVHMRNERLNAPF